jgi:hypothetical protein
MTVAVGAFGITWDKTQWNYSTWLFITIIACLSVLLWAMSKHSLDQKKHGSENNFQLTNDEKQVSCAQYVNILFSDLLDQWTPDGVRSYPLPSRAYNALGQLRMVEDDLRLDESLRKNIKEFTSIFRRKSNNHLIPWGNHTIYTTFETKKNFDSQRKELKKLATKLAKDLHHVTR